MRFVIENGVLVKCNEPVLVKTVTLPEEVTIIGKRAFADAFPNLKQVYLPSHLTAIEDEAFLNCLHLKTLAPAHTENASGAVLPDGLLHIGEMAFGGCSSLHSMAIPSTVQTIGNRALADCFLLEELTVPDTVQLGEGLLSGCFPKHGFRLTAYHPGGMSFSSDLPENDLYFEGIDDSILNMLLYRQIGHFWSSGYAEIICRMLLSGWFSEEQFLSQSYWAFQTVLIAGNTAAMKVLLRSEAMVSEAPEDMLLCLITLANAWQKFDLQLMLMDAMQKHHTSDKAERFQI